MLDSLTLNDAAGNPVTFHETATRAVKRVEGLVGIPGVKSVIAKRPQRHGSKVRSRFMSDRPITIEGECHGSSYTAAFAEFDALCAVLYQTLEAPALLKWQRGGGGLQLQQLVKLDDEDLTILEEGAKLVAYQAHLRAEEPRAFSQTLKTGIGGAISSGGGGLTFPFKFPLAFIKSGSGTVSISNTGIVPTPAVIRVYGYALSPTITLLGTGEQLVFTGEIQAGSYIQVDMTQASPTVKLNGSTNRMNLIDTKNTSFFEIPTGTQQVRMLASNWDPSAHVEVELRDAYVG